MVFDSTPPKISATTAESKLQGSKRKPEPRRSRRPTLIKKRIMSLNKSFTSSATKNGRKLHKRSQSSKSNDLTTLSNSLSSSTKRILVLTSSPKKLHSQPHGQPS